MLEKILIFIVNQSLNWVINGQIEFVWTWKF